jgi:hypothetical protein
VEEKPIKIDDFERYHARAKRLPSVRPNAKELALTLLISFVLTPFFFITFFTLPMMGQITVGFAAVITALYLFYRRSILVALFAFVGTSIFSILTFSTIQSIKLRVDIPIFIFLVMGVPVIMIYCIVVASRIWVLRGGE